MRLKNNHQRIAELDGLRGIAILLVMAFHFQLTSVGWIGVDLFFVLSGFLITRILISNKNQKNYYQDFYIRRALRILPAYFAVLALLWILFPDSSAYVVLSVFFLSNFAPIFGISNIHPGLWSLSVEEHFYLVWPWIVRKLQPRYLLVFSLLLCGIEPLLRLYAFTQNISVSTYTWFRLDSLAWGVILSLLFLNPTADSKRIRKTCLTTLVLGAGFFLLLLPFGIWERNSPMGSVLQFTLVDMICFGLLGLTLLYKGKSYTRALRNPVLRGIGHISYCLYLIHQPLLKLLDSQLLAFSASVALASVSYFYLEAPAIRLKKLFIKNRKTAYATN